MTSKPVYLATLLFIFSMCIHAEELTLQEQIDAIKEQIRQEETLREELRADLDTKDTEIRELKMRLEELEKKIVIGE